MSIRARLLWLVAMVMIVPVLLLSFRSLQEREAKVEESRLHLTTIAGGVARNLEERVLATGQLLFGLARARDLQDASRQDCSGFLARVRDQYPQFTSILTIDPQGQLYCDSLETGRNLDLADRDYFQRVRSAERGLAVQPGFGRLTGTPVLHVAFPARNRAGALELVLLASLNLRDFVRDDLRQLSPGMEILLIDGQGTALVWQPSPFRAANSAD